MKKYKIIGVDVDDVLVNFNELVLNKVNEKFKTNYQLSELEWNFVNLDREHLTYAQELFSCPKFFSSLEIKKEGLEFIDKLKNSGREIILVTSIHPKVAYLRYKMFEDLELDYIYTARKDLVKVDLLIDDSPVNAQKATTDFCLLRQPWNREANATYIIDNLEEAFDIIIKS